VSGSMESPDRLPLLVQSMNLLVDQLEPKDRLAIVVYAGNSGLVLPPTSGDRRGEIREALGRLRAGGSTNGGAGIELAYATARKSFVEGGNNRVILCTDGDFNVGVSNQSELVRRIEQHAKEGVFLSVLGFGLGNLKDDTMEKLADRGNGNYAYIDSLAEARKVLVQQAGGTLVTVAKDVKIQVEWNPAQVAAYRLIGYENRLLDAQDFNDDQKDAGEIGAGHTVTALYEVIPADSGESLPGTDPLKYQQGHGPASGEASGELCTVKLRYKEPQGVESVKFEVPVLDAGAPFQAASPEFQFAAGVAEFGMLLGHSKYAGSATLGSVLAIAERNRGSDPFGYRGEFAEIAAQAGDLIASTD
jgi:Ca-activated chloride channel homolog